MSVLAYRISKELRSLFGFIRRRRAMCDVIHVLHKARASRFVKKVLECQLLFHYLGDLHVYSRIFL